MTIQRSDFHTHTPLCQHAEGEAEAYVQVAIERKLQYYGISDHAPMPLEMEPFDDWRMLQSQLPEYYAWIERARKAAKAAPEPLHIFAALECDWLPGCEPWIKRLRELYPWDYLIGSIHYNGEKDSLDMPIYARDQDPTHTLCDWESYWKRAYDMAKSGLFDIIGHIDIIKIWGRVPEGDLRPYYLPFLEAVQESGSIIELNVAGWHKTCAVQYPSREILSEALKRGIPLCINSDAHAPEQLNRDWERALDILQELTQNSLIQELYRSPQGACLPVLRHGSL